MEYKNGAYYWIKMSPDLAWEIAQYKNALVTYGLETKPGFSLCGAHWGVPVDGVSQVGPAIDDDPPEQ